MLYGQTCLKINCLSLSLSLSLSTDLDLTSEMEPATWKEFHKKFIEQSSVLTTIGYGPFVPKPPTNPDVVHGVSGLLYGSVKVPGIERLGFDM